MNLQRRLQMWKSRRSARTGRRRADGGFSLIELLIAMFVLGIGLLSTAQMVPLAMAGVTQAGLRSRSVQFAQERLDDLKSSDFDSAALIAGTYQETVDNITIEWTITDDEPLAGTKRIDLTASWPSIRGIQSSAFSTFLSEDQ